MRKYFCALWCVYTLLVVVVICRFDLTVHLCRTVWCAVTVACSLLWWETSAWQRRSLITGQWGKVQHLFLFCYLITSPSQKNVSCGKLCHSNPTESMEYEEYSRLNYSSSSQQIQLSAWSVPEWTPDFKENLVSLQWWCEAASGHCRLPLLDGSWSSERGAVQWEGTPASSATLMENST